MRVDLDSHELEEVASDVFLAESMVARYVACYKADKEAIKAAEAAAAVEADLVAATVARAHWD
jgi:hypothetical protein